MNDIEELFAVEEMCRSSVGQRLLPLGVAETLKGQKPGWYEKRWTDLFGSHFPTTAEYFDYFYGRVSKQIMVGDKVLARCPYHPTVISEGGILPFYL